MSGSHRVEKTGAGGVGSTVPSRRSTPQQFQRETNLALVLRSIRDDGPSSRSELAARIGIDRSTMTSLAAELLESGVVREGSDEPAGSRGGRRRRLLSLSEEGVVAAGMELGDEAAEWSLCALGGHELERGEIFRRDGDDAVAWALHAFSGVGREIRSWQSSRLHRQAVVAGMGVGVPGTVDPSLQVLRESIVLGARSLDLSALWMEAGTSTSPAGLRPVLLVDNDANCCAWNIAAAEPGPGTTIFVQLRLHGAPDGRLRQSLAGVGLSFVMNGRVYYGSSHAAGEMRGYRWRSSDADQLGLSPPKVSVASAGDVAHCAGLEEISAELLRNLGVIASALDPGLIVLGGDLAGHGALIRRQLDSLLAESSLAPLLASGTLRVAEEGEYRVSLGAARMVLHELFTLPTVGSGGNPDLSWQAVLEQSRSRTWVAVPS